MTSESLGVVRWSESETGKWSRVRSAEEYGRAANGELLVDQWGREDTDESIGVLGD
jgi:hypothetical protein